VRRAKREWRRSPSSPREEDEVINHFQNARCFLPLGANSSLRNPPGPTPAAPTRSSRRKHEGMAERHVEIGIRSAEEG